GAEPDNVYLPHNTSKNRVVYTGTHDNDTTRGWWQTMKPKERALVREYLGGNLTVKTVADRLTRAAFGTVAELAVVPMQDVLNLGGEARMNVPGTMNGPGSAANNWRWRMAPEAFDEERAAYLKRLGEIYGRTS
ncbi:MAG: 4-alpha-glucanotransferase, partial [Firmicutes bacterium]|nr:4-alpha-glucanotransferase [Bacillota bacterium]